MSNQQPFVGKGTVFYRMNDTTQTWEAISRIMSIEGLDSTQDTVDVTTLDSEGGYREHIGGLRDAGTLSLPMAFRKDTYTQMRADFEADDLVKYRMVLPDLSIFEFMGKVVGLSVAVPLEDKVTATASIKISGKPDFFGVDNVVSVASVDDKTVPNGTQLAEIGLPETVSVTLSDDSTETLSVQWDVGTPMYDGGSAGVYNFKGELVLIEGVVNLQRKQATCKVTVGS